jgi:spectinomycin phosphotransferase
VRERPADIHDSDVAAALARHWAFTVQDLSYLPVGFGGYHWLAVDKAGSRWFVTISDLAAPLVPDLPAALASLGVPWNGGPYAEPGRDLLARYERPLRQAFARFDGLLDRVPQAGGPYVITHGEPHPRNLLRTRTGLCLVDWDMTALARPERDLWWVISGDQDAARYSWRTGWTVHQDALALYRLRWGLNDIAEFLSEIRGPHQRTADTLVCWTALQETLEAVAEGLEPP